MADYRLWTYSLSVRMVTFEGQSTGSQHSRGFTKDGIRSRQQAIRSVSSSPLHWEHTRSAPRPCSTWRYPSWKASSQTMATRRWWSIELSGKHWSDDLVTAKGMLKNQLLRPWPSASHGLGTQAQLWARKSDRRSRKATQKSLPGRSSRPTRRSPTGPRIFYQCSRKAMLSMNIRAAVGRRTLVKRSSVSPNEPNNTCLPSCLRRSQIWRSTSPTRPSQNMWSRTSRAWLIKSLRTKFKVVHSARCQRHLDVLEALYIRAKIPLLCQQKEHMHVLSLV